METEFERDGGVPAPNSIMEGALVAVDAVVGDTAFDGGEGRPPFVLEFDIGTVEVGDTAQVEQALDQAAAMARTGGDSRDWD